jgi:hypothetical protein
MERTLSFLHEGVNTKSLVANLNAKSSKGDRMGCVIHPYLRPRQRLLRANNGSRPPKLHYCSGIMKFNRVSILLRLRQGFSSQRGCIEFRSQY